MREFLESPVKLIQKLLLETLFATGIVYRPTKYTILYIKHVAVYQTENTFQKQKPVVKKSKLKIYRNTEATGNVNINRRGIYSKRSPALAQTDYV